MTPNTASTEALPPLPPSCAHVWTWRAEHPGKCDAFLDNANEPYFTADQMNDRWREGFEAGRTVRAGDAPRDVFEELRALTEALLTGADADYLTRQVDAAVKAMAERRCLPPVPWPDEDFGIAVWGRAGDAAADGVEAEALRELLETFTTWARQVAAREDVPRGIRSAAANLHDDGKRRLAAPQPTRVDKGEQS